MSEDEVFITNPYPEDIDTVEDLLEVAFEKNIHPVCLLCKKPCKQEYSFWSFQMPPDMFCENFEEGGKDGR